MDPAAIAHVVHEANRALQIEQRDISVSPAEPWETCSAEMRESAVDGVKNVIAGATSEQSHENWCRFKEERGWVYGPIKSELERTHPCLVPYAELPEHQRLKDDLFGAVVRSLAADRVPFTGKVRVTVSAETKASVEIGTGITDSIEGMADESIAVLSSWAAGKLLREVADQLVENAVAAGRDGEDW